MEYALGVDLGTTYTAAAVWRDGRAQIASLGDRAAAVPSVVFLRDDGQVVTGDAAVRRLATDPDRVAREFKRRLGDETPIFLGGTPMSAENLMGKLLRWTCDSVARMEDGPPARVVVSHPANWGPYKRELLTQAIEIAGLQGAGTITEPQAAAVHYASLERVDSGTTIAVYDLGGGTFDAAVLRKTESGFEVLGDPVGIERLGGIDFDAAVFDHVRRSLNGAIEALDPDDERSITAVGRLRQECIEAKEALSNDTDAAIPVMLPNLQTEVRITRPEFEAMIRPSLADSVDALRRAVTGAGLAPDDITSVLLVGGSSRIPLVADMVSDALGRPIAVDSHPKHAVALGAAILAGAARAEQPAEAGTAVVAGRPGPPADSIRSTVVEAGVAGAASPPGRRDGPPWKWIAAAVGAAAIAAVIAFTVLGGGGDDDVASAPPESTDVTEQSVPVADDRPATVPTAPPASSATTDGTGGASASVNLAAFARVTVSGEIDGPVEFVNDGDPDDDGWNGGGPPAWVEFDLRTTATLDGLRVTPAQEGRTVRSVHRVSVRTGAVDSWEPVTEITAEWPHGQEQSIDFDEAVSAVRFVRIETLESEVNVGWSEIEILGVPDDPGVLVAPVWDNVASTATVTASSEDELHPALNAVDGIVGPESAWVADSDVPAWIQLDLPQPTTLEDVVLFAGGEAKYGRVRFEIAVARNGGELTPVAERVTWLTDSVRFRLQPPTPLDGVTAVRITRLDSAPEPLPIEERPTWWEVELWSPAT